MGVIVNKLGQASLKESLIYFGLSNPHLYPVSHTQTHTDTHIHHRVKFQGMLILRICIPTRVSDTSFTHIEMVTHLVAPACVSVRSRLYSHENSDLPRVATPAFQ